MQIVCMWSNRCHCHPKIPSSLASFKSKLVSPFWYRLVQVVLEKRPALNGFLNLKPNSDLTTVDILNFIHKETAAMRPFTTTAVATCLIGNENVPKIIINDTVNAF